MLCRAILFIQLVFSNHPTITYVVLILELNYWVYIIVVQVFFVLFLNMSGRVSNNLNFIKIKSKLKKTLRHPL